MDSQLVEQARALPVAQRVELIDAIWETVAAEGYEPPLSAKQAEELDRRLDAHRHNPDDVISWESIKEELNAKYR